VVVAPADSILKPVAVGTLTAIGTSIAVVEPMPSWPEVFCPQHVATPDDVTAQAWFAPVATDAKVIPAGTESFVGTDVRLL